MGLYNGVCGCSNDLTAQKYLGYTNFQQKWGVRSFKLELLPLAEYVTPKDRVSQYIIYNYLNNHTLYESLA